MFFLIIMQWFGSRGEEGKQFPRSIHSREGVCVLS